MQACFHVLSRIPHTDAWVSYGKFEILAYVWVGIHDIHLLDCLIFTHFIVETHGLCPTTVQGITGKQGILSYKRMREKLTVNIAI